MTLDDFRKAFTDAVRNYEIRTSSAYFVDLRDHTLYWAETATLQDARWTQDDADYPARHREALSQTEIYSTRFYGP